MPSVVPVQRTLEWEARRVLNPPTQYATDRNLAARQRFWAASRRDPPFELFPWVLDLAGIDGRGSGAVLDVGCGNGEYEDQITRRGHRGLVCAVDLSLGILRPIAGTDDLNADVQRLPFHDTSFDIVLAPHMLYHVPDVEQAARECRRVLKHGGVFVAVTNGESNIQEYRELVQAAVGTGWRMERPAERNFSLENGAEKLMRVFDTVERVACPPSDVVVTDLTLLAGYIASVADHYGAVVPVPWDEVVLRATDLAEEQLAGSGELRWRTSVGAFVCR
jgi:SAM-dependent methyltransferase